MVSHWMSLMCHCLWIQNEFFINSWKLVCFFQCGRGEGGAPCISFIKCVPPQRMKESKGNKKINVQQLLLILRKEILYLMKAKPSSLKLPYIFLTIFGKPSNVVPKLERFWMMVVLLQPNHIPLLYPNSSNHFMSSFIYIF